MWPDVWSGDVQTENNMAIHDTECPYRDQVSLNNKTPTRTGTARNEAACCMMVYYVCSYIVYRHNSQRADKRCVTSFCCIGGNYMCAGSIQCSYTGTISSYIQFDNNYIFIYLTSLGEQSEAYINCSRWSALMGLEPVSIRMCRPLCCLSLMQFSRIWSLKDQMWYVVLLDGTMLRFEHELFLAQASIWWVCPSRDNHWLAWHQLISAVWGRGCPLVWLTASRYTIY